ncbi:MAG: AbrB/MazE/SpoVT family DNA-binding domain-containing protein [Bacillota bacterium]|nr:AbrB/MazE/SpoVT family DNA-binding domain-containing protein [Bacillota bacterium]
MLVKILKWGNSLAIRIPKAFASEVKIKENSRVELTIENGKLSVKPVEDEQSYQLEQLLNQVNEENVHYEIDTGEPQGKEIW